jgi:Transcription factor WhiB
MTTATATSQFNRRILELTIQGERPRCADPITHNMWTSEDAADRATAALWCNGCDVLDLCAAVAVEEDHRWGVWGGHDFSRRAGRSPGGPNKNGPPLRGPSDQAREDLAGL